MIVLASGRNENGAIERFYCGFACASAEGWPWLTEEWRRNDGFQRDLFAVRESGSAPEPVIAEAAE